MVLSNLSTAAHFPALATDVLQRIVELLRLFNSRTTQVGSFVMTRVSHPDRLASRRRKATFFNSRATQLFIGDERVASGRSRLLATRRSPPPCARRRLVRNDLSHQDDLPSHEDDLAPLQDSKGPSNSRATRHAASSCWARARSTRPRGSSRSTPSTSRSRRSASASSWRSRRTCAPRCSRRCVTFCSLHRSTLHFLAARPRRARAGCAVATRRARRLCCFWRLRFSRRLCCFFLSCSTSPSSVFAAPFSRRGTGEI